MITHNNCMVYYTLLFVISKIKVNSLVSSEAYIIPRCYFIKGKKKTYFNQIGQPLIIFYCSKYFFKRTFAKMTMLLDARVGRVYERRIKGMLMRSRLSESRARYPTEHTLLLSLTVQQSYT